VRDGIYKDLPMPRVWRSLMRACLRPAERGETARRLAERAMHRDASQEISPSLVQELCGLCSEGTRTLPGIATPLSSMSVRELGGHGTPLEQSILSEAQHLQRQGLHGQQLVQQAVIKGLETWEDRQYRQIEQHGLSKAGDKVQPTLRAARQALGAVDKTAIAQRLVSGESQDTVKARQSINIDEDLMRPK
jgi:hypothetical protein